MAYHLVPAFVDRLRKQESIAARALEFVILTAGRTSEVLNATWQEINLGEEVWTVPAGRMKAGEEHTVPLSEPAIRLLKSLHRSRGSYFVFPGLRPGRPLSSMSMEMLLRRMKVEDATVHGFRSSFRDWCGDETPFSREVAEAALAHKVGNVVERAYRRGKAIEKRRKLMEMWARFINGGPNANVVRLPRREAIFE
jgi:integrase